MQVHLHWIALSHHRPGHNGDLSRRSTWTVKASSTYTEIKGACGQVGHSFGPLSSVGGWLRAGLYALFTDLGIGWPPNY